MDNEEIQEIVEDEPKEPVPSEVVIKNKDKRDTTYDDQDAEEYDEHKMSKKEIEEFENGNK